MITSRLRELLPLYMVTFLGFLGYALIITLYIPMLMDNSSQLLPATSTVSTRAMISGLLLAMYPLGQFFGSPIIGKLSDHYGRKKILQISLLACILGFASIGLSIEFHSLSLLFISSFFTGLCESNMAISQSVIADRFQDSVEKAKYIGYAYSACSLGYVVGPLFGGAFASHLGYSAPFFITAIGVIFLMTWIYYSFKDQYLPHKTAHIDLFEAVTAIKTIFNNSKLYKTYIVNFFIFFCVLGLYRVAPLYVIDKWKISLSTLSILISYVSLICLISNLFILERVTKRFSTQKLLSGLLLIGGVLIILIIAPNNFNWIWLTYGIAVIPTVMALPACTTWLSEQVNSSEQGQVLGNNQALLVLGESSSAAIGGLIAAIMIPLPIFIMGIILIITGIAVAISGSNRSNN